MKAAIFSVIVALFFSACMSKAQIVYVPVSCDVKERKKPESSNNVVAYLKEVLIYAQGLEQDLQYCKGQK